MKALFYDEVNSGEGLVVREKIDNNTALMKDGQHFDYTHSIDIDKLRCPSCKNNENIVFKGDHPEKVSDGYAGACLKCNVDYYLFELLKE